MSYGSPRWSGEILDCSMPMTLDTYDRCSYDCLYCFSYFQKSHTLGNYLSGEAESINLDYVKRMFQGDESIPYQYSQFIPFIKKRYVIQWGGLADQFDQNEKKYGVTLELLKLLKEMDYPLCFSTKATWWVYDDRYMDLFKGQDNWNTKISIICLDEKKAKRLERGVPSPMERVRAIETLSKVNRGGVTLRLRPFIIGLTETNGDHLELIQRSHDAGADAMSTEFFCLEGRANEDLMERYRKMSRILGYDIHKFYAQHSIGVGYRRLNYNIKEKYMMEMQQKCKEIGMRFFVSDAHHKEKSCGGSCCGLPESWNYCRGQFTEMLVYAKKNGKVYWKDMEKHLDVFKDLLWIKAYGFNTTGAIRRASRKNQTVYEYFREIWNTPNDLKSPYKYFGGVLHPIGLDEDDNVIYEYRQRGSE